MNWLIDNELRLGKAVAIDTKVGGRDDLDANSSAVWIQNHKCRKQGAPDPHLLRQVRNGRLFQEPIGSNLPVVALPPMILDQHGKNAPAASSRAFGN
jgi:hypothetical protein